jgi:predicted ATPase/DNA-binding SARP family transcriptional activator/DNA-binding CsgD family transcriptional regulator
MCPPARSEGVTRSEASRGERPEALRVWLLGGFRVSVGSRTITQDAWRLKKAAALVKLLALTPGHRLHREQIMDILWPDSGRRAASNNLRKTLHGARKVLDPDAVSRYLVSEDESLVLCPGGNLWVDMEAFEEAAAAARREQSPAAYRVAIELYAGDLLPQDRYEEWAENRREELRQSHLALLIELARLYEERGEYGPAVGELRRVIAQDPTFEEAHVGLMRLYALVGRKGEALSQYERLREILSKQLGTKPGTATRNLHEDVVTGRFPTTSAHPADPSREGVSDPTKHNLPAPRDSFVGRERELREVKRELAMTRLLTLTGAGGSGKTRLALEVGRDLVGAYADAVWLTELAGISDGELVPQAVAEALRVQEQPDRLLTETLVESLRNKSMLLMVDNCEHLVDAAARLTEALLDGCPRLRILATSREALGVVGESLWPVPALSVPDSQHLPTVAELEGYEAARLFVERASDRRPGFALEPANAAAVAEVCRRLDGIPLAIELAAARVGTMSVEQIAERLGDSLRLLTGGSRTTVARQRTLRGALDWSHELLIRGEQILFGRLSVFAGGWTLEAAEAVAAGGGIGKGDILELLSGLVDKSLVVAEASRDGRVRYRLLEPVRQYAQEKLEESGEAEAVRRRHARFFLVLAEEAEQKFFGPEHATWLDRLEVEHDNMRGALSWTLRGEDPSLGLRLATAIWKFWATRGYFDEAARWLQEALAKDRTDVQPAVRAGVLLGLGCILRRQSDFERARANLEEALGLYEELEDRGRVAKALEELAWVESYRGDHERATPIFEQSLAVARESGNRMVVPLTLLGLAQTALERGDHKRAVRLLEEALVLFREQRNVEGVSVVLGAMGYAELVLGNHERATALYQEALALGREVGNKRYIAIDLSYLGIVATLRGDPNRAKALLKEALMIDLELLQWEGVAEDLEGLAEAAGALGGDVRAARLWGTAGALREAIGIPWGSTERLLHEPQLIAAQSRIDEALWEAGFAEGRAMGLEKAVEYALSEEGTDPSTATVPERSPPVEPMGNLTRRERELAYLVARGLTNRQIALELSISEHTAATHVRRILKKLGLQSRVQIGSWLTHQRP